MALMWTARLGRREWTITTRRCRFDQPVGYGPARAIYRVTLQWSWHAARCPAENTWYLKRTCWSDAALRFRSARMQFTEWAWASARNTASRSSSLRAQDGATIFDFDKWYSSVASRRNDDGTISFILINPTAIGFNFVVGERW
jgi:hypothetical protein